MIYNKASYTIATHTTYSFEPNKIFMKWTGLPFYGWENLSWDCFNYLPKIPCDKTSSLTPDMVHVVSPSKSPQNGYAGLPI